MPFTMALLHLLVQLIVLPKPRMHAVALSVPTARSVRPQASGVFSPSAACSALTLKGQTSPDQLSEEAERLLAKAREIRDSIPEETERSSSAAVPMKAASDKIGDGDDGPSVDYRLYVDVGREPGTWMDPRWGASGRRIEFTVDVGFAIGNGGEEDSSLAGEAVVGRMVKDNFGGRSSPVRLVKSEPNARLRGGFDKMGCHGGGYRIDVGGNGSTVRFHLLVDGTPEVGSSYGDVSIPKGCLHFSIPCFANSVEYLSSKESPVTVRQVGWHTGWRREESRMVGTFRAAPIKDARRRDKY